MNKTGWAIGFFVLAFLMLVLYSTLGGAKYRVELCMTFKGQTACKTVSGHSEKAALEAAITGACADIAQGVTDTVNCTQSQPAVTKWLSRPGSQR